MKKGKTKINISKKKLQRIEKVIFILLGIIILVIVILTRTPSATKAQELIEEQYKETEKVLSQVMMGTNWLKLGKECIEQDGYTFCKSETSNMQTYEDLREYIEDVCTTEYTEDVLKKQELIFKDISGKLYVMDTTRNQDIFYAGLKEIKVKNITSHEIQAEVICNYYIDLETKTTYTMSFDYTIKKGFSSWKTSQFTLPY